MSSYEPTCDNTRQAVQSLQRTTAEYAAMARSMQTIRCGSLPAWASQSR
jgi:hypothetical protein